MLKLSMWNIKWILVLGLIFIIPMFVFRSFNGNDFVDTDLQKISDQQPAFIFIGNSMLDSRIDIDTSERIVNENVVKLVTQGSGTPVWWLDLKNNVAAARLDNPTVFIFFRDMKLTELTRDDLIPKVVVREAIQAKSYDQEEILETVLSHNSSSIVMLAEMLDFTYPIMQHKARFRNYFLRMCSGPLMPDFLVQSVLRIFSMDSSEAYQNGLIEFNNLRDKSNKVFEESNSRNVDRSFNSLSSTEKFKDQLSKSFLPPMVNLALDQGIHLVFIRVQKRPDIKQGVIPDDKYMSLYFQDLINYLHENTMEFYDFTNHPSITSDYYLVGDHISPLYRSSYTEIFWDTVSGSFQN